VAWTAADVVKVLEHLGYEFKRHGAKHDIFDRASAPRPVSVPRHRGDLPVGTVRSIWRQANIDPGDAERLK
jgi:predicted RNA binding protein YcfA (HicA-like mRNA interferase family)